MISADQGLALATLEWCDQFWDDDRALPWGPMGHEGVEAPRSVHLIPQAGWYAVGLFLRDRDHDRDRAVRIIDAICDLQYDEPGTDWHGSYPIMAETPHPPPLAVMWDDYDPNWRQFLGLSWVLLLERFGADLSSDITRRLHRAIRLGVEGEPANRCPASYTNIALKRLTFESIAGGILGEEAWIDRAERLTEQVAEFHDQYGAFEEFNSPTYYGVDLYALSLGRQLSPSSVIADTCTRLEGDLWRSIGRLYHPHLRNLCTPWTRTYGMDMQSYVAKLTLSIQLTNPDIAPDPGFAADVAHGHDWFAGAVTALVGTVVPDDATDGLHTVSPDLIEQRISDRRVATAWMDRSHMIGAESCRADLSWWDQYLAAGMHWANETEGERIGWLSVRMPGPSTASATVGQLQVPANDSTPPTIITVGGVNHADPPSNGVWRLPGMELDVSCPLEAVGDGPFGGLAFAAASGTDVVLSIR